MDSLAFWMADQVCPLLVFLGIHACIPTTNLHLVGVAGWIFSGVALLMLMGFIDYMANRRAARRARASGAPLALKLVRRAPPQIYETPNAVLFTDCVMFADAIQAVKSPTQIHSQ
jgi:hypothetical protein